ncbi:hypothetical protein EMIHUDRAFT_239468 [Emiliania huxleyi CCMP1516]|uniref:Uncharacterized protein n=2 Tax=Emiliania huxleyi TaxID=2903 RepID=A0A0D3JJ80_EMIH1|nr:hypothetical protein EMIHUDRAFT_239468 [Emiliania huxleyi CCMP1516]EOD23565.1 hypothetical protein EMIHUDRAFT_239468 [Emiliania huxleyi CCMP1516]|eukprot:XP_005775994.1 hypothetical protein EMIHUDRAFT_239468 [Emiliania huxleyi CCMP1516]
MQGLPLTLLFAGAVAWRAGVAAPARPSLPHSHHQRRGSPLSFAVPPDGESDAFGQAPQAPQQQPPPFVSSDEDELAEEEEGGALTGSGPASPDEWGLVRRAALTVGMVVPALVLAASLQRAGERAISEADRRAIVEAIREDVAVLEGYAETAAAYRRVLTILRLWVGDGERLVVAPTADSPERLRLAVQEYRRPWTETLPWRR